MAAPDVSDRGVEFALPDPHGRLIGVRLAQELGLRRGLRFRRQGAAWRLKLPRPEVDRMEYLLEVRDHNGHRTTITDPGNPLRAPGAFGDKSVVVFPGYQPPDWLDAPTVEGTTSAVHIECPDLGAPLSGDLWSPADLPPDEPAPLLVVHDGPEFASLGAFTSYLASGVAARTLPPVRAALLGPGDRNAWYSAHEGYAAALAAAVPDLAPATVRIGVGVSLGALAVLHLHRTHPGLLDGMLLQSGSFFTPALDAQETGFAGFGAVTRFVQSVHDAHTDEHAVPVAITCGLREENLANNQAMAATLHRLGYRLSLREVRDTHNFTAWRDALHPTLTELVTTVVGARAT